MLTPQWLDQLRSRITLSTLIGRSTRLQKAGREYKACCPFHNEKSPSFTVNDEKGFYHCLAGETLVITDQGRLPIRELAGTTTRILSRNGKWIEAPFRDYGRQRLWRIALSRNGQRKTLYATDGHRWFVRGRKSAVTTAQLRPGHRLEAAFPAQRKDWTLDAEGIRHGIVFGDGTLLKEHYGSVNLHGAKDAQLAPWFPESMQSSHIRDNGEPFIRVYGGRAFGHMKALPDCTLPEPYLLGFLAGYFAADGHVAKDGTVMLNCANADHLEAIRDLAATLGIGTFGRTTQPRKGIGGRISDIHRVHFVGSSLRPDFFLLDEARQRHMAAAKKFERLRWQVVSVSPSERVENVYCAEVPDEHAFAIDDNILTGNCFGCGAHGDAIRWMTDHQGLAFMDAVKELAAEAGMDVPAPDPRAAKAAEKRDTLHDVMAAAQEWFAHNLSAPEGEAARAYLATRGFDAHTVQRFGFGYAPEGRQVMKEALSRFPQAMLIEAGLRIEVEGRDPYDRFRGRLMLPIEDTRGRVIAFGGRILANDKTDAPKYLNSPDTPLFDKGRTLYNLHRAAPAARQSGRMVVVEGYMDVIALAAAGIAECVAPLGTALTEHQIELLWRHVERPVLCFDGDAAGQRAAMRAITRALPLLRPAHSLRIVRLPEGMDPDDLIKAKGPKAMEDVLGEAKSLIEVLWEVERDAQPLNTPEDKAGLKARLMAHVESIQHPDIASLYRRELQDRYSEFAFPKRENRWQGGQRQPFQPRQGGGRWQPGRPAPAPSSPESISRLTARYAGTGLRDALTAAVLAGLMRWPAQIGRHAEALARTPGLDPRFFALIECCDATQALESEDLATILSANGLEVPGTAEYSGLRFGFLAPDATAEQAAVELSQAIDLLVERPVLEAALAQATTRFESELSDESFAEQQRLLKRKLEFDKRLRQMASRDAP